MTGLTRTLTTVVGLALAISTTSFAQFDPEQFSAMSARSIGPSGMSGRIGAIDAVNADPNIVYVGAATGGLWKSVNGGFTWEPIMDDLPAASIGAIAINQPNPDLVWVGTGERNRRNSAGVGTGIYKSNDAGKTWTRMGLENTGAIDAILIDPRNSDVVYVGALGNTWNDTEDRGAYKTADGGRTWQKILYVNNRTGAGDLVMDPSNPDHLIAAMWEHRRWPWYFKSGGEGSGLHVTYDGGGSWKQLGPDDGLPEGELGRIGLDFARGKPDVVYALVEAEKNAVLRSDDGGDTWEMVNQTPGINGRPFYYGQLRVDPTNENRVWIVESPIKLSEDGGKNFEVLLGFAEVHVDHHAFWVSPDGQTIYDGNDGGVYIARDGGHAFRFVENLPLAQFYHIAADMATPYHVLGGLQDNGSWRGPAVTWHNGGIRYYDWYEVGFGDGFATFLDPSDPRHGYATSQNGGIIRFDLETGERRGIRPADPEGGRLRFNWNPAMNTDPFDGGLYLGSQFVHKSLDQGASWQTLSPDLTTNDVAKQMSDTSGGLTYDASGAEAHTAILVIAPSSVERGVIWVGTDDGNVQVTRDGGTTWQNVVDNIRGVPANTWVPSIRPSRFDGGTAFVVFDNHRNGDNAPYLFKTTNYGRSWESLVNGDLDYFLHTIEQDPINSDLLFAGSEFGMFVSLNGGDRWHLWTHGLPRAPVRGLVVHPREHDLVIGTHGRSAYVLDDVRPLREMAADQSIATRSLHLFAIPDAVQYQVAQVHGIRFTGFDMFLGENRPYGALLSYWIAEGDEDAEVTIEVMDASGEVVRTFSGPAESGLNRTAWNLQTDGARRPEGQSGGGGGGAFGPPGPPALPGDYTIRVFRDADTVSAPGSVAADPRFDYTMRDRRAKADAIRRIVRLQEVGLELAHRLDTSKDKIEQVIEMAGDDDALATLREDGRALVERIDAVREDMRGRQVDQGFIRNSGTVNQVAGTAYGQLASSWGAPTPNEMTLVTRAEARMQEALGPANDVLQAIGAYRDQVVNAGIELLDPVETIDMSWRPAG